MPIIIALKKLRQEDHEVQQQKSVSMNECMNERKEAETKEYI